MISFPPRYFFFFLLFFFGGGGGGGLLKLDFVFVVDVCFVCGFFSCVLLGGDGFGLVYCNY